MNIFNAENITTFFGEHYFLFLAGVFLGTFLCTWYTIPKIIWVSNEKKLTKPIISRSAHAKPIPSFGGVAFFLTLILTLSLVQALRLSYVGNHLIAAITILFLVGLKDDLVISTARVKLVGQIMAIFFIIFSPELQIFSLHGFWGIQELPGFLSFFLAGFLMLSIINAYNLIDGIDGLASIVGIVIATAYTLVFYLSEQQFYVLISVSVIGILAGFIRYNFSRGRRKIFMGDSGSLIIGLVIGFLSLRILSLDSASIGLESLVPENRILFVLAVLFIPFFDTTRSIMIRLLNKKSPFEPDRNHSHHVLLDAGLRHWESSFILGAFNTLVIGIFLIFSSFLGSLAMTAVMLGCFGLGCFILHLVKKKTSRSLSDVQSNCEEQVPVVRMPEKQPLCKQTIIKGVRIQKPAQRQPVSRT